MLVIGQIAEQNNNNCGEMIYLSVKACSLLGSSLQALSSLEEDDSHFGSFLWEYWGLCWSHYAHQSVQRSLKKKGRTSIIHIASKLSPFFYKLHYPPTQLPSPPPHPLPPSPAPSCVFPPPSMENNCNIVMLLSPFLFPPPPPSRRPLFPIVCLSFSSYVLICTSE